MAGARGSSRSWRTPLARVCGQAWSGSGYSWLAHPSARVASRMVRSVPGLITEYAVATSTSPGRGSGARSVTSMRPARVAGRQQVR